MRKTFADLFSGCGGAAQGAKKAGFTHAWGVELDSAIAEIYKANIGNCFVQNILNADPCKFEKVDLLHASPICKSYSMANANKGEKQLDIDCAHKVADFIQVLQPPTFTLENVQAYVKSKAFNIILEMLYSRGYWVNYQVLNAANFGVPQSRRRLILIAVKRNLISDFDISQKSDIHLIKNSLEKGDLINNNQLALFEPPKSLLFEFDRIPSNEAEKEALKYLLKKGFFISERNNKLTAVYGENIPSLPSKEKHIGWYEAIKDKVDDLEDSDLAPWQWKALPNSVKESLLVPTGNTSFATKEPLEPSFTLTSAHGGHCVKAILIENTGARSDRDIQTRAADEPCWTLRAMGQDGHWHRANALLVHPTDQRTMPVIEATDPAFTLTSNQGGNHIKALLENAHIVQLDIACLARLQSFPDDYKWSGRKSLDGKGIGNSVPPLMYEKILRSVYQKELTT